MVILMTSLYLIKKEKVLNNLVENLTPPFYAAFLNDNKSLKLFDSEISPADRMVSIAPQQSGFLGLETTRGKKGTWVTISYWSDMDSEKKWEQKGDNQIRKHFEGIALKETCTIRISKINHKLKSSKRLYTGTRSLSEIIMSSSISTFIFSSCSLILQILSHKAVR